MTDDRLVDRSKQFAEEELPSEDILNSSAGSPPKAMPLHVGFQFSYDLGDEPDEDDDEMNNTDGDEEGEEEQDDILIVEGDDEAIDDEEDDN